MFSLTATARGTHICVPYSRRGGIHAAREPSAATNVKSPPHGRGRALDGAQRAPSASKAGTLMRLFAPRGQTLLAPQFRCAQLWPRARNPATSGPAPSHKRPPTGHPRAGHARPLPVRNPVRYAQTKIPRAYAARGAGKILLPAYTVTPPRRPSGRPRGRCSPTSRQGPRGPCGRRRPAGGRWACAGPARG